MRGHYAKLFVDGAGADQLVLFTAEALHVTSGETSLIKFGEIEIEPRRNPDHGPADAPFLTWPVIIEIEAPEHVTQDELVEVVASILSALWNRGIRAVAAAEFEERLPRHGGWHGGEFIEA